MRFNLQLFDDYWNSEKKKFDEYVAKGDKAGAEKALQNMKTQDVKLNGGQTASKAYESMSAQLNGISSNTTSTPKKTNSGGGGGGSSSSSPDYSVLLDNALSSINKTNVTQEDIDYLSDLVGKRGTKLSTMTSDPNYSLYQKGQESYLDKIDALSSALELNNVKKQSQQDKQDIHDYIDEMFGSYNDLSKKMSDYDFQQTEEYKTLLPIYQEMYRQLGEDARKNTLADATGLTGGLTNSYAIAASQQAQNDYNSRFTQDVIPQLMDLAYNRYANGANFELESLNSAQSLLDKIANADQNYLNNMYNFNRSNRADYESDRNFNEGVRQYDQNFDYQKERDRAADDKWNKEFEQSLKEYQDGLSLSYAKLAKSGGSAKDNGSLGGYSDEEIYQAALGAYQEMLYLDDPSSWYKKSHSVDIGDGWKQTETNLDVVSEYGPKFFTYLEQISKQAGNASKNLLPDDEEKIY